MAGFVEKAQQEQAAANKAALEDFARTTNKENPDFWDNVVSAVANQIIGHRQFFAHYYPSKDQPSKEDVDKIVDKTKPAEGWGAVLGDAIASLPLAAVPGGPVLSGITAGTLGAAGTPVHGQNYDVEKAVQMGTGGSLGATTGTLAKLVGQLATRSLDKFVGKALNTAAPPGAETITDTGNAGFKALSAAWDDAYSKLRSSNLTADMDNTLMNDLSGIEKDMIDSGAPADQIKRFQTVVVNKMIDPMARGPVDADVVQNIQSGLAKAARGPGKDISYYLYQARNAFLGSAERSSPDDAAQQLSALREKYPDFLAVQKAVAGSAAQEGLFTPQQLAGAARSVDSTANKAATATADSPIVQLAQEAVKKHVGELSTAGKAVTIFGGQSLLQEAEKTPVARAIGEAAGPASAIGTPTLATMQGTAASPPTNIIATPQGPSSVGPEYQPVDLPSPQDFYDQEFGPGSKPSASASPLGPDFDQSVAQLRQQSLHNSAVNQLGGAIMMQESGGRNVVSPQGARGPMQIMPTTFRQYAQPGEHIDNPVDNITVGQRLIGDLYNRYGDPREVAAAYFSGKPNYTSMARDITGKSVMQYVADVMARLQPQGGMETQYARR